MGNFACETPKRLWLSHVGRGRRDERIDVDVNHSTGHSAGYVQVGELGKLLAQRRRQLRLSLGEVTRQTGISAATLSRWERQQTDGKDPHKLQILARWLGV